LYTGQTIIPGKTITFEGRGLKKDHQFFLGKRVTPSVTAPGDTNLSDDTATVCGNPTVICSYNYLKISFVFWLHVLTKSDEHSYRETELMDLCSFTDFEW